MFDRLLNLSVYISALLILFPATASATTLNEAQAEFDRFKQSDDSRYAPATTARAQAYLGAAMLVADKSADKIANEGVDGSGVEQSGKQIEQELQNALTKAHETIEIARNNARLFRQSNEELLSLQSTADELLKITRDPNAVEPGQAEGFASQAEKSVGTAIEQFEAGNLGGSRQSASEATLLYNKAVAATLPDLAEKAGTILGRAASTSAKSYAPETYRSARELLTEIERYNDGLTSQPPVNPVNVLLLAEQALEIATQVKRWRRDAGSHEAELLKHREVRLKTAEAAGLKIDRSRADADISGDELIAAVKILNETLQAERAAHAREIEQLKLEQQARLQQQLEAERNNLLSEQSEQLSSLKEAFRAKLERETFETKRQKQLRSLFSKGEAETLVNVDGSLLIRLTSLKFASGSSKITPKAYDLLGKLKNALAIYSDRKARIEGHTDSMGDVKVNQKISLKRAEAVRDFLIAAGIDASKLKALGYGEVRPIASNEFDKGRAMNRRIDVVIEAVKSEAAK